MTYQRWAETAYIDKVSIEMQHVLEAVRAYNVDSHGDWPDSNNESSCTAIEPDFSNTFIKNYVPNQNVRSRYGAYFCWSSAGKTDNNKPHLFWVAFKVPNNNLALANRIAARLPNAIVTSDLNEANPETGCEEGDCYVRAEVVQPGMTSNAGNNLIVVATDDCSSHNVGTNSIKDTTSTCTKLTSNNGKIYRIDFAACPSNDLPRVTVFPNFIHLPKDDFPGFTLGDIRAKRTDDPCARTVGKNGQERQQCNVIVQATSCTSTEPYKGDYIDVADAKKNLGSIGASYIVACVSQADNSSKERL